MNKSVIAIINAYHFNCLLWELWRNEKSDLCMMNIRIMVRRLFCDAEWMGSCEPFFDLIYNGLFKDKKVEPQLKLELNLTWMGLKFKSGCIKVISNDVTNAFLRVSTFILSFL